VGRRPLALGQTVVGEARGHGALRGWLAAVNTAGAAGSEGRQRALIT
jgi:hypothetical protein